MRLKTVKNDTCGHGYCGPIAVAAITGRRLSRVLDVFRVSQYGAGWKASFKEAYGWRKRPVVKGTGTGNVREVFDKLGYSMREEVFAKPMTIERWIEQADRRPSYLIEVDHHWIAVGGRMCCDTGTHGAPVPVGEFCRRADPVIRIWRIERRKKI